MTHYAAENYLNKCKPTWCRGCSYNGVLAALTKMFASRQIAPHNLSVISGIGCSSRLPLFLDTYGCHTLHGRALPVAIGSRLARPEIPVVVVAGDGDFFSIGTGHFAHAARENFDLTVLCLDNRMFAMTKNQASSTSPCGYRGTLTPHGKLSDPLNVLEFAVACNATFVARTAAGSPAHMQQVFERAFLHRGFSFVEILAPCRTFDRQTTLSSLASRTVVIDEQPSTLSDKQAALEAVVALAAVDAESDAPVAVGVFYEKSAPTFESKIAGVDAGTKKEVAIAALIDEFSV